ncbi:MAG: ABC transporter ATP-binding protein [Clostridia bacterium]|nr:ABC transporter ATP-binding protein [Clostridia bacterium]MBO7289480.1 ABC transporter ATP-binding protein [Clostridia bacterium]
MIELKDIYKIYSDGDSEIRALDGVSLFVDKGEFVAIVGSSGSGKSTCMNIVGCLDIPTSGKYFLNGNDVSELSEKELAHIRNRELGFVFQQYNLIPKLNVLENVELPLLYKGVKAKERKQMAMMALERVGLADRANKFPSQLSGGQQQRVSIARALAGNPPVILADEPTGALDSKTGKEVLEFLKQLNSEGTTVVLITHDNDIAAQIKRVVRIHDGKIVSDETKEGN